MARIDAFLRHLKSSGGSDLHFVAGLPPRMRLHGTLGTLPGVGAARNDELRSLLREIVTDAQWRQYEHELELDFAHGIPGVGRFRANYFVQESGAAAVFRLIPEQIPALRELNMPEAVTRFAHLRSGLVLVTGPTGSGKSTTLAAIIDAINETYPKHIITLEDPIEFVHPSKRCLINQREVGAQTHSFANALRSALREDPDVILVGELRDLETTSLALTAAETGHLVLATLHTSSAPKTIDRIIDMFPAVQQGQVRSMLSESLVAAISQMLVKKTGGGRAAALEILLGTPAVRNLIREGKIHQIPSAMQVGGRVGMQTMESALAALVSDGMVEMDEARKRMPGSELFGSHGRTAGTVGTSAEGGIG